MSQDTFNKLVTTFFLGSTMILVYLSWYFGKPIEITGFLSLMVPVLTHIAHIMIKSRDYGIAAKNGKTEGLHE